VAVLHTQVVEVAVRKAGLQQAVGQTQQMREFLDELGKLRTGA
jgi:hypothetical protein